jgi:hypothetical protein
MILTAMGSARATGSPVRSRQKSAGYLGLGLALGLVGVLRTDGALAAAERPQAAALSPTARPPQRAARRPLVRAKHNPTDQDILDQAQAAYIRGERQHAIDLATSVAEKGGTLAESAWRFIGLAACSVRAARLATRAYGNLAAPDDQQDLVRACRSNGLALLDNQFVER